MATYNGYDVSRSLNGAYWYAVPSRDVTTERKLKTTTPQLLKIAIDAAIAASRQVNPWQLAA